MFRLVLASGSPRRREMLSWTGLEFSLCQVDVDETPREGENPADYVRRLAIEKAKAAIVGGMNCDFVLAADTTVADGMLILGKPANADEAYKMLKSLRSRSHRVFTALALMRPDDPFVNIELCGSLVPMRSYSNREIQEYIASGDPMDKAGAYAIQNSAFHPVDGFQGCFANVMGLPLCHLVRMFQRMGIESTTNVPQICQQKNDYTCPIFQAVLDGKNIG